MFSVLKVLNPVLGNVAFSISYTMFSILKLLNPDLGNVAFSISYTMFSILKLLNPVLGNEDCCFLAALIMDYKRQASNTSSSDAPTTPTTPTSPTPVDHDTMVALCKSVIPPLTYSRHKGEAGRIGVIGGCEE